MFEKRHRIGAILTSLVVVCVAFLPVQAESASVDAAVAESEVDTLVLQPGSEGVDSYVYSFQTSGNFGAVAWFHSIGLPYSEALLRFDLSPIPPGSTILSAVVDLWGEFRAGTISISTVESAWDEATVTWNSKPSTGSPSVTHPIDTCSFGCTKSFDVIDVVRNAVDHPELSFGFDIKGNTQPIGWMIASSDNPTPSYRPRLTVRYVAGGVPVNPECWSGLKSIYR